jgi:hypothetical protein
VVVVMVVVAVAVAVVVLVVVVVVVVVVVYISVLLSRLSHLLSRASRRNLDLEHAELIHLSCDPLRNLLAQQQGFWVIIPRYQQTERSSALLVKCAAVDTAVAVKAAVRMVVEGVILEEILEEIRIK